MKNKQRRMMPTNIMLEPDTLKKCREWGKKTKMTASQVIRLAVEILLSHQAPDFAVLREKIADETNSSSPAPSNL